MAERRTRSISIAGLLALAASVNGSPPEVVNFENVPSSGLLNEPYNAVRMHQFNGGYALGEVRLTGTLTSLHNRTWRTDSRILITSPHGATHIFQPFTSGTTFNTLNFNRTIFVAPGLDPAGEWTFRFFEFFQDANPGEPDARWNLEVTFTDVPPEPPSSVEMGTVYSPGKTSSGQSLSSMTIRWYRFTLPWPAETSLGTWFDIDTVGSVLPPGSALPDDTIMGLYDASGNLVAVDDDSGPGFAAQLSFGAGGRAGHVGGLAFDGQNGDLPAGTYYLAVGGFNVEFNEILWNAIPLTPRTGTLQVNLATNLTTRDPACYANCDASTSEPILTVDDFTCFINAFAEATSLPIEEQILHYANCDRSTTAPVLTVDDFTCFINAFAEGCP